MTSARTFKRKRFSLSAFILVLGACFFNKAGVVSAQESLDRASSVDPEADSGGGLEEPQLPFNKALKRIHRRLHETRIPRLEFDQAGLADVAAYLELKSKALSPDGAGKGVNIIVRDAAGKGQAWKPVTLKLEDVSLHSALKFAVQAAGARMRVEEDAVVIAADFRDADKAVIYTRVFWVPHDLVERLGGIDGSDGAGEPDPFLEDPEPDDVKPPTLKEIFLARGIEFPPGSDVTLIGDKLIVRNTGDNLELMEAILDGPPGLPNLVQIRLELYSLPQLEALELMEKPGAKGNAVPLVRELRKRVAAGKADIVSTPGLVTKSATRARVALGHEHRFLAGYEESEGKDEPVEESAFFGTLLEVDPLVSADNKTIDLNLKIRRQTGEAKYGRRKVVLPVSGEERFVETVEIPQSGLDVKIVCTDGDTLLLGSLLPGQEEADSKNTTLVFAKITLMRLVREDDWWWER